VHRLLLATLLLSLVVCAPAGAKLTPKESTWVTPMLKTWTQMNSGLNNVVKQATAPNALIAGTANNGKLTKTLVAFVSCTPEIEKAGTAPTSRLEPFAASMQTMCTHLGTGAQELAKAIGAIRKGNATLAKQQITAGYAELAKASTYLKQAGSQIVTVGGQKVFTA
jgi:hypothetical protein